MAGIEGAPSGAPTRADELAELFVQEAKDVARQALSLASKLADLADRPIRVRIEDLKADHTSTAVDMLREVQWATANLGLGRLIRYAADADREARKAADNG